MFVSLKKHIAFLLLLIVLVPTSIQLIHELENHEHAVCSSINEHHFHQNDINCDEFHKQLTPYTYSFLDAPYHLKARSFTSTFISKPQQINTLFKDIRFLRGPPIHNVYFS